MDLVQVLVLSIVEGLTEFLPVSSTGHMILVSSFLGNHGDQEKLFEVFIQLGAILSVVSLYSNKLHSFLKVRTFNSLTKMVPYSVLDVVLACLPPMIIGFLFYKKIKALLFTPISVAIALIVGGIWLIYIERKKNVSVSAEPEKIGPRNAFFIGCFQCLSLWPGFSRSGSCIIGGKSLGLSSVLSIEFSFIVSIPLMVVAVLYDIYKSIGSDLVINYSAFTLGFVIAYISAFLAVKTFISYISSNSLVPFGVYRIILGLIVLIYFY